MGSPGWAGGCSVPWGSSWVLQREGRTASSDHSRELCPRNSFLYVEGPMPRTEQGDLLTVLKGVLFSCHLHSPHQGLVCPLARGVRVLQHGHWRPVGHRDHGPLAAQDLLGGSTLALCSHLTAQLIQNCPGDNRVSHCHDFLSGL